MAIKLELYKVFKTVAEKGNISAAAQDLYISQSAVSQSIKQLERQLDARLFSRSTKGVTLTNEGEMLLDYVSKALGLIESGEKKLSQVQDLQTGTLSIGASDTITKTYLLRKLEAFHKEYPGIILKIINGTSKMCLDNLHAGLVDIAFASGNPGKEAYDTRHLMDTHTVFVASPDYNCDFDKVYTIEEIAAFPLILLEKKAGSRLFVDNFFKDHGVEISPEFELGTHNLLTSIARIGLGVACVTEEFARSGLDRGIIKTLKTDFEIPTREMVMCTLKGVSPTPAATHFMDFITEAAE